DEGLSAADLVARAALLGLGLHVLGPMMGAFVDGERADQLARSDLGQPSLFLSVRAAQDDRAGRGESGRHDRRGGEGAAGLLEDEAEAEIAKVGAAVGFWNDDAGPAHLGHLGE